MRPAWHYEAQQLRATEKGWTYDALAAHFGKKGSSAAYNACLSDERYAARRERARKYWHEHKKDRRKKVMS